MTVRQVERVNKDGKKGAVWVVDVTFRHHDGRVERIRRDSPVNDKSSAKELERQIRTALLNNTFHVDEKVLAPTVAEFFPRFMRDFAVANRQKHSTVTTKQRGYEKHLAAQFGSKRLDAITAVDIQKLKGNMAHLAPKSVNNILSILSKMLKVAVDWEVITQMPCRIKLLKTSDAPFTFYDFEEYARLVEAAQKLDLRVLAFVLLAGDAGLREGEAIALEWSDIHFKAGYINIQRAEWGGVVSVPKGGRSRKVPMTKLLSATLQSLRHLRGTRVFYRDDGRTVTPHILRDWMESAQRVAILEVTGRKHMLRHTFCSHLAMRGASTLSIKELAGHQDLMTTQKYMHLSPNEKDKSIALLDAGRAAESAATAAGLPYPRQ